MTGLVRTWPQRRRLGVLADLGTRGRAAARSSLQWDFLFIAGYTVLGMV